MKTIAYLVIAILIPFSCNQSAESRGTRGDSLEFYPPTPGTMNTAEFRHYYRLLSGYFDSTLLRRGFNGAVLVAKDGNILYEKYYGLVDLRGKDSINEHTSFHIASATKPFTGVAILRLVQENRLSLDEPLETYFPDFPYPGVTVRMLLNHRSGIPNYMYFSEKIWDKKVYMQNHDVLDLIYRLKPKRTALPGQSFQYCNTNFVLLALIIEKITGVSYADYLKKQIFDPLGMTGTYVFSLADTLTATPSFTHSGTHWKNDFLEATYGDKNIYSTPRDLLKWDQALYTENVLSQPWLDSAFTPYHTRRPMHKYGLGWRLLVFPNGKKIVYHYGRWHGFNAAFARLVDERVTIIILGNKFTRSVYNSAQDAYKLFGQYSAEKDPDENGAGGR